MTNQKMNFILSETNENAFKEALKDLIKRAEDKNEQFIVLVPETKTLFAERFLLDNIQSRAFSNIYVYSFARLLKKLQVRPVFPLSKEAGVMIVRNRIMELQGDLVCYKKTANTVGFAENIFETIQQLKSSSISPEELSLSSQKCPVALKIKLTDIALLYDAYQNYLGEELIDPSDKLQMLEREVEISEKIKNANIYVLGFDSLTSNMASVISSLLKNAKSLTVSASFMHPNNKNAHISDNEVYERYKLIAEKAHIKYDPIFVKKPLSKDFKHIYENLYSYPAKKIVTSGNIRLFGTPTIDIETQKVAALIKESILKGEGRYKDNCIYLANPELKTAVERALEDYEIPYFSASPYQFESHPVFSFIRLLFQLVRRNFEAEDVIKMARHIFLEIDSKQADDFENYVICYGINHNKFAKPFVVKDALYENAESVRKKLYSSIYEFLEIYGENLTVLELCDAIFAFFEHFDIQGKVKKLYLLQQQNGDIRAAMATGQALNKANEVLKMLSQFLGSRKLKLDELYTLLISGLEAADINLLPLGIDMVQVVSNPDGLYGIKNLYVVGATDGNFPVRQQDLGLIQDAEITSLEGISEKKIEPTIRTINRRERYKVFELLLLADKLTISFSDRSNGGEELKMSSLVMNIADLFTSNDGEFGIERIFVAYEEGQDFIYSIGSKKVAKNFLAQSVSAYKSGADYPVKVKNVASLYKSLQEFEDENFKSLFESINVAQGEDRIENANKLFFPNNTTSISELESYFNCPLKHFVDYGLRLKERKQASMRALDVGDILHSVAERFVKHYLKFKNFDPEKLGVNLLSKILEEKNINQEDNFALIKILKNESKRLSKCLYDGLSHSSYVPTGVEQRFGQDKGIKVYDNPQINIVGKIDRLDETDHFYRIIDYKTGKISTTAEDIYYGHKLQLAIYLSAVSQLKKNPAGVLYFPIHNEFVDGEDAALDAYKMRGFILNDINAALAMDHNVNLDNPKSHYVGISLRTSADHKKSGKYELKKNNYLLSGEELETIRNYALAVSSVAIKEILEGYHKASPYAKGEQANCQYCLLKNLCGVSSGELVTRSYKSKAAKTFYKEGEIWKK